MDVCVITVILAIKNNAAINILVCLLVNIYLSLLDIYPRVKLLGPRIYVWLSLVDTANQFSRVVVLGQLLNLNFQGNKLISTEVSNREILPAP